MAYTSTGWSLVLLCSAGLCMGCSLESAADAGGTFHGVPNVKELEEFKEITEGSFRALTIGESKDQVLAHLLEMGMRTVSPDLPRRVVVTKADDLSKLRLAEGIIIGAGDVTIAFDGNDVKSILVAPIFPEWNALLRGVKTRQEAFRALAQILQKSKGVEVRALAVDARDVWIHRLKPADRALLDKYDLWGISHDSQDGYIHMDLEFLQGALRRISVLESPVGN